MLKAVSNILYDLPPTTWDQIQLINTTYLPIGATVKATDLSMHTFVWDGAYWQSLNNGLIKVGSSRTQVTITTAGTNTAYAVTIPANLIGNGGRIIARPKVSFTPSTNSKEVRIIDNATQLSLASALTTNASVYGVNGELSTTFETTSSLARLLTQGSSNPYAGVLGLVGTIDTTVVRTLNIIIIMSAAETAVFYGYDMYVERRT